MERDTMPIEQLMNEIDRLPHAEKWRLVNHLLQSLEHEQRQPTDWKAALKATHGILADDPIERPPQLPLEDRELFE